MHSTPRLRYQLYFSILPLVVVIVLLSGVVAALESRAALTNIADRHMDFKAEQLRNYFFSEWSVITKLGLDTNPQYRAAVENSFRSYGYSLLRRPSEMIVVFDDSGRAVMEIRLGDPAQTRSNQDQSNQDQSNQNLADAPTVHLSAGWFAQSLFGAPRVGVAFLFQPFKWTVAVTDLESSYFSDVRNILQIYLIILLVATVAAAIVLSVFVDHIVRPVERLTETIGRITERTDLAARVEVGTGDEIGTLGRRFNEMIGALQSGYRQLEAAGEAERVARQIAIEREEETLFVLARASEYRDEDTGDHLKRIGDLCGVFSMLLGQSEEEQELLRRCAPLHDIGKIGIPDSILLKAGTLTDEERERMKSHTLLGNSLLRDAKSVYLIEGARIAMTHHEKWDGSGYPNGLAGDEIPLHGRMVSLVDVFDALSSARPYKPAWNPDEVRQYLIDERGKHFDPALVDIFVANFALFEAVRTGKFPG